MFYDKETRKKLDKKDEIIESFLNKRIEAREFAKEIRELGLTLTNGTNRAEIWFVTYVASCIENEQITKDKYYWYYLTGEVKYKDFLDISDKDVWYFRTKDYIEEKQYNKETKKMWVKIRIPFKLPTNAAINIYKNADCQRDWMRTPKKGAIPTPLEKYLIGRYPNVPEEAIKEFEKYERRSPCFSLINAKNEIVYYESSIEEIFESFLETKGKDMLL